MVLLLCGNFNSSYHVLSDLADIVILDDGPVVFLSKVSDDCDLQEGIQSNLNLSREISFQILLLKVMALYMCWIRSNRKVGKE